MREQTDGLNPGLMPGLTPLDTASSTATDAANGTKTRSTATPSADALAAAGWPGDTAALDRVRESLRAARQQVEGAVTVLRERGALDMDAAEAFARARSLCRRAERRLAGACGVLSPAAGASGAAPTVRDDPRRSLGDA
ncbi:MAG TPA: hypothetical protein VFJ74_13950 [Gemmatimonadaceae bacterium]|nr:hypothetical protein [Gemmatimonadaceae bacterium]